MVVHRSSHILSILRLIYVVYMFILYLTIYYKLYVYYVVGNRYCSLWRNFWLLVEMSKLGRNQCSVLLQRYILIYTFNLLLFVLKVCNLYFNSFTFCGENHRLFAIKIDPKQKFPRNSYPVSSISFYVFKLADI